MAEREGALVQYLLRYIRGLSEPTSDGYTLIIRMVAPTSASFQILTLHRSRHTKVAHVKAECMREFRIYSTDERERLVLRYENDGEDLQDDATLASLALCDVTMMCVYLEAAPARSMLL